MYAVIKKLVFIASFLCLFQINGKAQKYTFDTVAFNQMEVLAKQLVETEDVIEYAKYQLQLQYKVISEDPNLQAYAFPFDNGWIAQFGVLEKSSFKPLIRYEIDSSIRIADTFKFSFSRRDSAFSQALSLSVQQMQAIIDTNSFYFSTVVIENEDKTLSIWYLPAFQPSGQALYGVEWCFNFTSKGDKIVSNRHFIGAIRGVWIGQPREGWLNYRTVNFPTVGSLYFALKYRDYFTRLRIDTLLSVSSTSRNALGGYFWEHKIK